jgi:hypothetical protein
VRSSIQCIPEEQVADIDLPTLTPVPLLARRIDLTHQDLNVLLEDLQIRDSILDELWSDQLPRVMPLIQICRKDRVSKKVLPFPVERLPLAVVSELSSKYGLDVLRLGSEDASTASRGAFNGIAGPCGMSEESVPDFKVFVVDCTVDGSGNEIDIWEELSFWISNSGREDCTSWKPCLNSISVAT